MSDAVVDTSVAIGFLRGDRRAESALGTFARLVVPVAVVAELLEGCHGVAHYRARAFRQVEAFLRSSRVLVTPATAETAERWAVIHDALRRIGRPVPINDVWVAASAMEFGLPVVTYDRHFLSIPQVMVTLVDHDS